MNIRIPRWILWRERNTIEEFLCEPIYRVLHEAFYYFEKEPMLFPMEEVTILNEVGYQVTWLCHESRFGKEPDMNQFAREVFANTGLKDHAMTVISMVWAVVDLVQFPPLDISKKTRNELKKLNKESWCRRYMESFVKRVKDSGEIFSEQFLPYHSAIEVQEYEKEVNDTSVNDEPSYEGSQDKTRRFTLDEIVEYAKNNLTAENTHLIQNMLFNLLVADGTVKEREKVSSILPYIINRDKILVSSYVDHQTVIPKVGNYYNQVNTVENKFPSVPPMNDPNKMIG